jgi:hypothetical protein
MRGEKQGRRNNGTYGPSLFSVGKKQMTSLSVKKQGREANRRRPRRELRRPCREGVSGVRAGGVRAGRGSPASAQGEGSPASGGEASRGIPSPASASRG